MKSKRRCAAPLFEIRGGRFWTAMLLLTALLMMSPLGVQAETYYGSDDWGVTFTADDKLESNFDKNSFSDVISGMQPGDNVIITLKLSNSNGKTTHWYMTNEVLNSLEDSVSSASGGAYTYILTYQGADPETAPTVLFSSDTVGGEGDNEGGEGLHEATNALEEEFLFLDTLYFGQTGTVTLEIALDGETQGNGYQDTLANLAMNFAVEPLAENRNPQEPSWPGEPDQPVSPSLQLVKTGDDNLPIVLLLLMATVGVVLMGLSIHGMRQNRRMKRG